MLFMYTTFLFFPSVTPKVELMMGSHLNASDLREGHDAFLECRVKANPPPHRLEWFRNVSISMN